MEVVEILLLLAGALVILLLQLGAIELEILLLHGSKKVFTEEGPVLANFLILTVTDLTVKRRTECLSSLLEFLS